MPKTPDVLVKSSVVLLLLVASYLRHTFLINPNLEGNPWLISIRNKSPEFAEASFKSMMVFYIVFGIINGLFARFILNGKVSLTMTLYFGLILLSAFMYGLFKLTDAEALFNAGSIIKNFVLSPLFAGTLYIWATKISIKEKVS